MCCIELDPKGAFEKGEKYAVLKKPFSGRIIFYEKRKNTAYKLASTLEMSPNK